MTLQELIRKKGRSKRLYSQAHLEEEQKRQSVEELSSKGDIPQPQQEVLKRTHQENLNEEEKFIKLIKPSLPNKVEEEPNPPQNELVFPIDNYTDFNYNLTHTTLMNLIDLVRLRKLSTQTRTNNKCNLILYI